jgi:Chaperone of endosialidase
LKYWEIIADNVSKAGWSWGCVSAVDANGRTIWIADAHRDEGNRFVVRADEKLTAFLELELAIRRWALCLDELAKFLATLPTKKGYNCMRTLIKFKTITLLFIPVMLGCFALLPCARAVSPAPDGGYPGFNTAEGQNALAQATLGVWNTAIGGFALNADITGGNANTAVGLNALGHNTTGDFNTAVGVEALLTNVTGSNNTALGGQALKFNTTGSSNTAVGINALVNNTSGIQNVAIGQGALHFNNANFNVATGYRALYHNTTGIGNTATGQAALFSNTTGRGNTACSFGALDLNSTGRGNTALGTEAGINITTGNDNIDIANKGVAGDSNTIRIGAAEFQTRTFVAGVSGAGVTGSAVLVNSSGQLGVKVSSQRFKDEIKPMDKASEAIFALKPVSFRYKKEIDPNRSPEFGLVAEDVEKVNADLVVRDADGKPYTVRYDAVNAMLLNEFLKEHRKVQEQEATITQLKKEMGAVVAYLKEQDSKIQTVSAHLEVSKPAPQTALNNQ